MIAVDFRCAGRSEKPIGSFELSDLADDNEALLQALGIVDGVDVIGAALGSLVGALLAIRHPERVRRLMMCTVAPDMAGPTRAYVAERAEKVRVVGMRGVAEASLANSFPVNHPQQRAAYRAIYLGNDPVAYAELSLALARLETTSAGWAAIRAPTLVASGAHDFLWPPEIGRQVADLERHPLKSVTPAKAGVQGQRYCRCPVGVDGPRRHRLCQAGICQSQQGSRPMTIIRIGLDTSKRVFQLHGVDEAEQPVLRKQLKRGQVEKFFAALPPTRVGLEACGASHHWARVLRGLGHEPVLLPPQYVKPYVKRGKHDAADAAAICEAMSRPHMRFVPVKSAEQQARLVLLKSRELFIKQRTMAINAMRGHAAEFGVVVAKGAAKAAEPIERVNQPEAGVPELVRRRIAALARQLAALEGELKAIDAELAVLHKADPTSQCLATQPGVGPLTAITATLKVPDPKAFRSGRDFAAWLGATPKENSTAGKRRPGKISREGDETLRRLLVLGATAVIRAAERHPERATPWLRALLARKPKKLAAVALANKMARTMWAMMVTGEVYRRPQAA